MELNLCADASKLLNMYNRGIPICKSVGGIEGQRQDQKKYLLVSRYIRPPKLASTADMDDVLHLLVLVRLLKCLYILILLNFYKNFVR